MPRRLALLVLIAPGCSDYELNADAEEPPVIDTADGREDPVPDAEAPVAVCDVYPNPVQPPFEKATWDGADSYDPAGQEIVEYRWTLEEKPSGSAIALDPSGRTIPNFMPDLAGDYVASLVVVNEEGLESAPVECVLNSLPAQDLWIEMFWDKQGDDMDLHLMRPGGELGTNGDCYFGNCIGGGLSWGAAGTDDDPRLDLDDIPGTGPENINISSPAAGTYTVAIHDYPQSVMQQGNAVTVKIYVGGLLEWSDTRTIDGESDVETFAEVDWPAGTVTPR